MARVPTLERGFFVLFTVAKRLHAIIVVPHLYDRGISKMVDWVTWTPIAVSVVSLGVSGLAYRATAGQLKAAEAQASAASGQLVAAQAQANTALAQLNSGENLARRARERGLLIARATLPRALSTLQGYVDSFAHTINETWPRDINHNHTWLYAADEPVKFPAPPPYPAEDISVLCDIIEYCDDDNLAEKIAGVVKEFQVIYAFASVNQGNTVEQISFAESIMQCLGVSARIEPLIPYGLGGDYAPSGDTVYDTIGRVRVKIGIEIPPFAASRLEEYMDTGRPADFLRGLYF